jgi:hypothetical protein
MAAAVAQPSRFSHRPLTLSPMTARLLATSRMTTSSGGVSRPLTTAAQNSASMALSPQHCSSRPAAVEAAMTP